MSNKFAILARLKSADNFNTTLVAFYCSYSNVGQMSFVNKLFEFVVWLEHVLNKEASHTSHVGHLSHAAVNNKYCNDKIGQGTTIADVSKHFKFEQTDGQTNCH